MSTPTGTPLRTKRNFKSLQLPTAPAAASAPADANPLATRSPPAPAGKKRPPPLGENVTPAIGFLSPGGLESAMGTGRRSAMHATLSSTLAKLDMNAVVDFNLQNADLKNLAELGQGNGGSVMKVEHVPTGTIMAKKVCGHTLACFLGKSSDVGEIDCSHRREAVGSETNPAGAADNARLQVGVYRLVIRGIPCGAKHLHLHGVHGQGVVRWDIQADWAH